SSGANRGRFDAKLAARTQSSLVPAALWNLPHRQPEAFGLNAQTILRLRWKADKLLRFPPPDPTHDRLRRLSLDFQRLSENECISAIGQFPRLATRRFELR